MTNETEYSVMRMPMVALRGITVFPDMNLSFDVERPMSIAALGAAFEGDRRVFLTAQKDVLKENPAEKDLYLTGVICTVRQFIKTHEGNMRVMVDGKRRARIIDLYTDKIYLEADVIAVNVKDAGETTVETEALIRSAISLFDEYCSLMGNFLPETISLSTNGNPNYVADYIAQNTFLKHTEKQKILEELDPIKRLKLVSEILAREIDILKIQRDINEKLRGQLMHTQRENVLREQIRVIQAELSDNEVSETDSYLDSIYSLNLPQEIEDKLVKEVERLAKQSFSSAESSVIRGYLDACLELPWHKMTKETINIEKARKILEKDHFGLEKVKERIIEFLAVKKLAPDMKGSILCLVGPPGVGKTSIAISIAKALNRKLSRMSLGGVHDEAEIRGHRKTYIGAMPGRIMTSITQAGSRNPLLLLDEIDKLGSDYKGDPSSALLEALDPEQNSSFRDHYLEIPFDLSDVMFITTANTTDTIPRPLLDRMEVIELSSYTDEEKLEIAKRHLIPKQRKKHGLDGRTLKISDNAVREIISGYTRESGVRQLERKIAAVCRKSAALIAEEKVGSVAVQVKNLETILGTKRYKPDHMTLKDSVGIVNGLAWTSVGGEILEVEAVVLEGSGKLELTGNLGNVMKESAQAAVSYIRSRCDKLGIDKDFYKTKDIHIHFPEGAVPKDGPSAGITITIALISALTGIPVRGNVAMTGEITLSGRILAIGGLKEKTMAALRYGVKTVVIPTENEADLNDIDQTVRRALNFVTASHADDILDTVLCFPKAQATEKISKETAHKRAGDSGSDRRGTVIRQ